MSAQKYMDKICCVAIVLAVILTLLFMNGEHFGIQPSSKTKGYETRLFDTTTVHTIDIIMDDWDGFLETCTNEEYSLCSVVIDNEAYQNVGIRAKGNTSLTQVASYGNDRYSFKIEFDHYDSTKNYYGLDKLSLNNIIQDNTFMKDYLSYQMMGYFGADAPLCSFVSIRVNGENWGLYLAVEGVEEAFLERNYGRDYGELYKPDSMNMGGGRGNGGKFQMDEWQPEENAQQEQENNRDVQENQRSERMPNHRQEPPQMPGGDPGANRGGMGGRGGSSDVSLIYTDDEYTSYQNIFDNAKTDITDADKDRLIASLKQLNEGQNIEETVNVDEVIRYFVVHNFVCNFDSYTGTMIHNYYLYEKDGQLSMIPWDYNLAFGGFQGAQDATALVNYPIDTPVSGSSVDSRPMLAWIFANTTYTELYHQYFSDFISAYFESGYFAEMIDSVLKLISPYVQEDPTKFCTYEEFEAGIRTLKEFCLLRAESIRGQLAGTIASTSEGQAQASETLVDASGLNISDMGSMNGRGRGGMGAPAGNGREAMNVREQAQQSQTEETQSQTGEEVPADALAEAPDQQRQGELEPNAKNGQAAENRQPGRGWQNSGEAGAQRQPPTENAPPNGTDPSAGNGQTDAAAQGENASGSVPPNSAQQGESMPENAPPASFLGNRQANEGLYTDSTWILIGICAGGLLIGILIAALYKKRG